MGCNGALLIKLAFGVRTPTPAAVKEGGPLVLSSKSAPWLRAVLRADGTIIDQGFGFSPYVVVCICCVPSFAWAALALAVLITGTDATTLTDVLKGLV